MYQLTKENQKQLYKDTALGVEAFLPEGWEGTLTETPVLEPIGEEALVEQAIRHPAYGKRLSEIAKEKQARTACILVSDATRAVPTARTLPYVVEELLEAGISYENIHAFVAVGVHRDATEAEMQSFLGELAGKISIENHTPFDREKLRYLGETSRKTPVWVNERAYACDLHIQIGKVEPHEFAGFSGGRKSVLPGVSGEETILVNHRPEMILDAGAAIGVLDGNPVHEDMEETARLFRMDFGVNCILNNQLELAAVFAGEMQACHRAAVDYVKGYLGNPIPAADILVTTPGEPLDIDFYQSVKALIALTEILEEKTVVILYCGCPEGVNSPDMLRGFRSGSSLEEAVAYTSAHYKIQMDHVLLLSKILRKKVRIVVCCPHVSDEEIRDMFMIPGHSLKEGLALAAELTGKEKGRVLFYPRPQTGLPVKAEP